MNESHSSLLALYSLSLRSFDSGHTREEFRILSHRAFVSRIADSCPAGEKTSLNIELLGATQFPKDPKFGEKGEASLGIVWIKL